MRKFTLIGMLVRTRMRGLSISSIGFIITGWKERRAQDVVVSPRFRIFIHVLLEGEATIPGNLPILPSI